MCSVTHALADSLGVASSPLDFFVIGVEEPDEERPATAGEWPAAAGEADPLPPLPPLLPPLPPPPPASFRLVPRPLPLLTNSDEDIF